MKFFLVGGAVRDELLGLTVAERDWVVVGGTEADMLAAGFKRADGDFPVFLHPTTGDEYALARRERKVAPGYRGFDVDAGPDVVLEEDLVRRDLTINAIARDDQGVLIDPFDGRRDLEGRVLRHVSEAFVEDPLRLLRTARFAAQLGDFGFQPAPETLPLLEEIVASGELDAVTPAHRWRAMKRSFDFPHAVRYFDVLKLCRALAVLYPDIEAALRRNLVPVDALAAAGHCRPEVRFAVFFSAIRNESADDGLAALPVERSYLEHLHWLELVRDGCRVNADERAEQLLRLFERLAVFHHPRRLEDLLSGYESCGTAGIDSNIVRCAFAAARAITGRELKVRGLPDREIGTALRARRVAEIGKVLASWE